MPSTDIDNQFNKYKKKLQLQTPIKPEPKVYNPIEFKVTNYCFNDYIDANFMQMNPVMNRYFNSYKKDELAVILEKKDNEKIGSGNINKANLNVTYKIF